MKFLTCCSSFLGILCLCSGSLVAQQPYRNPALTPAERARDLVSRMTLDEQILQMQNSAPAIPRLGVPSYNWWNEALHGVARAGTATVFPQAIGMAATWNPGLLRQEADVISTEARAKYRGFVKRGSTGFYEGLTFWSPNINIFRDPRWGRGQETYGEDPFLTSRMGVAFVRGLQGDDPSYFKAIATPKHFAVHSGPEPLRHQFDARPPLRDLYETYLPSFEAAIVEGGAWSVMGAYNRVYGEACCASHLLLEELLRGKWKFKGYVVSDCGAIDDIFARHKILDNVSEASAAAVKHGCDLTCGGEYQSLHEAVDAGLITSNDIATSAGRLMEARIRLGMFDPPERVRYAQIPESDNDTPSHDSLALRTARESIVLLKNQNGTLPFSKPRSLAVVGPLANTLDVLLGNYNGTPSHPVTFLEGIRAKAGVHCAVEYARGCDVADGMPRLTAIPARYLSSTDANGVVRGLRVELYPNINLAGEPSAVWRDTIVDFESRGGSLGKGMPTSDYSARWSGTLTTDFTGRRSIGAVVDDGFRLSLDDSLIVEDWDRGSSRPVAKEFFFEAGRPYRVRLEYYQLGGEAAMTFGWTTGSTNDEADALDLARRCDVTVAVMGISPNLEGEEMPIKIEGFAGGDRTTLNIPSSQERLLRKLVELGKPLVLVLTNGSALSIPWEQEHVPAIVDAWYPGQQGGNAVADVLFGNYNPGGRLPITFYASVDDLPGFDNYAMQGRTYRYFRGKPLYPFGYGLSYSTFEYRQFKTSRSSFAAGDTVDVAVTVRNVGDRDGDEVVQVYVRPATTQEGDPLRSLKGFSRVFIPAGATQQVMVRIPVRELRFYDERRSDYAVRPGAYQLQVGGSSGDLRLTSIIHVDE